MLLGHAIRRESPRLTRSRMAQKAGAPRVASQTPELDEMRERRCCTRGPLLSTMKRTLVTSPDPGGC
jgi:hypothetical protein